MSVVSLTAKQEKFVQNLISGMSQREAYKNSYNVTNMKDNRIDEEACRLFNSPKISTRYNELLEEHKEKALYTREEAVNDLIWLKEEARKDIKQRGLKQANGAHFINSIKELCNLNDLYPKNEDGEAKQEKDVAAALRGLIDAVNT